VKAVLRAFVVASFLLTACFSDVRDEPRPLETVVAPTQTREAERPTATPSATARPAATRAALTATPAVARTPPQGATPAGTPAGTTGLQPGSDAPTRFDEPCLSGGGAGLPQPASLEVLPRRYTPSPFVPDATLQERLDESLGGQAGAYAFYVKDLTTGRGATHNSERIFNAASLFKLFIMYAVFHQESLGLVGWDDELVVTPYYDGFALTPRVTALCQALTVGEAMDAMLSVSDNAAAVLLQDLAGSGNVNASIEALGLRDSGLFETGLPVTAADLALLMEVIAIGQAVSPAASADMLRLLDHDVFENGLLAGVPEGTRVARKTGNWTDATHVAGIVFAPSGPYVFVALTSNGYERDVIEALSRVAYEHFEAAGAEP
jgi:beta-lactamase class A